MIKDLQNGFSANGMYVVKDVVSKVSVQGRNYLALTLEDASGSIDAKLFNVTSESNNIFKQGNCVHIDGVVSTYNDKLQIKIDGGIHIDFANLTSEELDNLIASSPKDKDSLINDLNNKITLIKDEALHAITDNLIKENYKKYITYPAASKIHHDFYAGLLHHSLSVCNLCLLISQNYDDLNDDLLISGALLHDLGKIVELSGYIGTRYTKEGNLLGHLVIGVMMIDECANQLNLNGNNNVLLLKHMIASHHGKREFGALVEPLTKEALVLSTADELDAKLTTVDKALKNIPNDSFSEKIFSLDNKSFYKN